MWVEGEARRSAALPVGRYRPLKKKEKMYVLFLPSFQQHWLHLFFLVWTKRKFLALCSKMFLRGSKKSSLCISGRYWAHFVFAEIIQFEAKGRMERGLLVNFYSKGIRVVSDFGV